MVPDSKSKVLAALKKNKVMRTAELAKLTSHRSMLRRIADAGDLFHIGAGIYAHSSIDPFLAAIVAAKKYYPKAVLSNLTALVIHRLSDERIDRVDIDIERGSSIKNKVFNVHRVPGKRLIGVTNLQHQGFTIRIYDRERSLCEAYRIDPQGTIFFKALKRYLKNGQPDIDKIARYDRTLKTDVLSHLRQELAVA